MEVDREHDPEGAASGRSGAPGAAAAPLDARRHHRRRGQAAAWAAGYDNYQILWKLQGRAVDRLPLHIRGELLAGLAQSAQRTGRKEEVDEYLDKIIEVLPDTGYERVAKQWKADPLVAAKSNISCKSCHTAGRLSDRMAKLAELEAK